MTVGSVCQREVIVAARDESVRMAARLMRRHHVGEVVVIDRTDGVAAPVGIVTDRDLVLEIVDADVDPSGLTLADMLTEPPLCAREDDALAHALHRMRERGVRRVPVTDGRGVLVGILRMEDVIERLADTARELAGLVRHEHIRERDARGSHVPNPRTADS